MKITIAQGAFLPVPPMRGGAVEKIWFALGREFVRRGHEVTHISRLFPGLPDGEVRDGVGHIRVRGHDTPRLLVWLKVLDLLYSLRVRRVLPAADILVTNTFWLPVLVRSKKRGALYVHVARYPKGQMRLYKHAARLQGVSEAVKEAILAEVPELAEKVCAIPNPLPNLPSASDAPSSREKRLLYAGRIHPEKGIHLIIEAVARIGDRLPAGWRLVLVGPWEVAAGGGGESYFTELRRLAQPLGDRVEFTGPTYEPARLAAHYRAASLFLYPSLAEKGETFGVSPLEAMSNGCPALVSDLACFRDFLEDDVNGFVFDHRAKDPAGALAEKIGALLGAPDRLVTAGRRGVETAARFSVERIAGLYLDDFQSLLYSTPRSAL